MPLQPAGVDEDSWLATLALQGFRQRSNLEVFRVKGEVAFMRLPGDGDVHR